MRHTINCTLILLDELMIVDVSKLSVYTSTLDRQSFATTGEAGPAVSLMGPTVDKAFSMGHVFNV